MTRYCQYFTDASDAPAQGSECLGANGGVVPHTNERTRFVALLRAVNLPGHNKVTASELRELHEHLGFDGVRSVLQSGNVVFRGADRRAADLERLLESEAERRLGLRTNFHVRTAAEWRTLIARNPFVREAQDDPAHLVVMVCRDAPKPKDVTGLQSAITGPEIVRSGGRQLYIVYPAGIGRSKLTAAVIERALGITGTGRNWNTVLRLDALLR